MAYGPKRIGPVLCERLPGLSFRNEVLLPLWCPTKAGPRAVGGGIRVTDGG